MWQPKHPAREVVAILGLAMVYGLVKQHGGFVHIESEVGAGTEVALYFPVLPVVRVHPETEVEESFHLGGTETVLVAEDNAALREVTAIRERNEFPKQLHGTLPSKRLKNIIGYTIRLEEEILELKGICKYLEGPCAAPRTRKVTQGLRSAS